MSEQAAEKLNKSLDQLIAEGGFEDTERGGRGRGRGFGRGRGNFQNGRGFQHAGDRVFENGRGGGGFRGGRGRGDYLNGGRGGRGFANGQVTGFQGFGQQGMPGFMMPNFMMPGFMMNAMAQGLPLPNQRLVTMGEPPMAGGMDMAGMMPFGMDQERLETAAEPIEPPATPNAFMREETGEVIVRFKATEIIRVASNGDMTLDSGGFRGPSTFNAMKAALQVVGVILKAPNHDDQWSLADGHSLTRFSDGMVLKAKGFKAVGRGQQLLAAFSGTNASAAAAATAASNAAAAAAGILPGRGSSSRGRGNLGPRGRGGFRSGYPGGRGRGRGRGEAPAEPQAATRKEEAGAEVGGEANGEAGGKTDDSDKIRRLKAQGRYRPY